MHDSGGRIAPCPLPTGALLGRYRDIGAYTDCYGVTVPGDVAHARFVEAFYTTWLFKLERAVLVLVGKPSTDAQARALAHGEADAFAAWRVEARAPDQLLLCDYRGRTRSWLMREAVDGGTRLYFGSAVVPVVDARTGSGRMGRAFAGLLGFHRLYSRLLLRAAINRLAP
jgi:hypothetical protein